MVEETSKLKRLFLNGILLLKKYNKRYYELKNGEMYGILKFAGFDLKFNDNFYFTVDEDDNLYRTINDIDVVCNDEPIADFLSYIDGYTIKDIEEAIKSLEYDVKDLETQYFVDINLNFIDDNGNKKWLYIK